MKVYLQCFILLLLLAAFACFAIFSSAQRVLPGQTASQTNSDLPIYLNGELLGSLANTGPLVQRLKSLEGKIGGNANLADGRPPNIGRILLLPGDTLSIKEFGLLRNTVGDFYDYPPFERMAILSGGSCAEAKQGPAAAKGTTFVLSNAPISKGELLRVRSSEQCWLPVEVFTPYEQSRYYTRFVKSYRVAYSSMEITDTGSYVLNEQAANPKDRVSPAANMGHPTFGRRIDAAPLKQRPIAVGSLEQETLAWIDRRIAEGSDELFMDDAEAIVLPIIVNGKAPFSALSQILKTIHHPNVKLTIIVN